MHKGQSSIDFMLAVTVALVFFAVLNVHNDNLARETGEISLMNGLGAILLDVYSAAGSAKAYDLNIAYASPKLEAGNSGCVIRFRDKGGQIGDLNVISGGKQKGFADINLAVRLNGTRLADYPGDTADFGCGQKFTIGAG